MRVMSRRVAYAFVIPSLLCLAGTIGWPLVQAVLISLYRWNLISGVKRWNGLQNFIDILTSTDTARVVGVTIVYTVLSVLIELVLGLALALLIRHGLAKNWRGFSVFRVVLCIPIMIAPLIWAFYFKSMYSPQFGLFNTILSWLGFAPVAWVNSPAIALYSLMVADAWQWTPFMFAILLAGLLTLPEEVTEAAIIDGATRWQILRLVELPLLKPILMVALLLRTIDSLKNIDLMIVITQGGPGTSTEILNYYAYSTSFQRFQMGSGAALALIVFVVIMALVLALMAALNRTNAKGGKA
ncbi:carbohydrate ABC transporter permease [Ochrobactrum soli]|uniref:Sugar ABC transporter permease n=1 Tax=Ochrobactrum soli TaxID=2448455 RepID=A0A849KLV6_9HYPH|nr:sugar ABC transporter permease [[Ochrobactrum] soli]NNU62825.1 sugar ABC transporter permease [[Ochrobactrum] soli]